MEQDMERRGVGGEKCEHLCDGNHLDKNGKMNGINV